MQNLSACSCMSNSSNKLFRERNLSFMKRMKVNKHNMVTAAAALLTLSSIGATPATIYAASSNNGSEIVSVKSEPDSYTKDSLTKLITIVQSKAFQDKVANEKNESDAGALKQALSAAQDATKDDSATEMTNTGRNLHRIAVKIDRVSKKQLGNLLEIGRSHKSDTTVSKPYQNAQNVNDNLGADLSLIRDAASSLATGLNQDGVIVEAKKDKNETGSSSAESSSSDSRTSGSSSEKSNDSNVMYGGTGRQNLSDQSSTLIESPITPSYKNQLDQNVHLAESPDMQSKTTLASKDTQEDLDTAIKEGKAMIDSQDSARQDQANATLLKAMNRVNNEAKEPLKLLDGEMLTLYESNGFNKLDYTVQQDYNNTMQEIETVLSDSNATYGDIIAAEITGNNTLKATLTSSDKTWLKSTIDDANALATSYLANKATRENLSSLTTQVALARQVLNDKNASQSDVDQATQNLRSAETQFLTTLANSEIGKDTSMESTSQMKKANAKAAKTGKHTNRNAGDDNDSVGSNKSRGKDNGVMYGGTGRNDSDGSTSGSTSSNESYGKNHSISKSDALHALYQAISKANAIKGQSNYKQFDGSDRQNLDYALDHAESVYNKRNTESVSNIINATDELNEAMKPFGSSTDNNSDSDGSGDSTTAGDTASSAPVSHSRGALPQTGHFIIQHAKAIMAAIAVVMTGLVGLWYKNNKDKDNKDNTDNKKA